MTELWGAHTHITSVLHTQAVLTSHVVIRGRYSKLWITISGVPDCDDARPPSARSSRDGQDQAAQPPVLPKLPCPRSYTLAGLKRDPEAGLGPLDKGVAAGGLVRPDNLAGPLHTLPLQQTVSLPLPTLPPVYVDALCRALNYCSQVGYTHNDARIKSCKRQFRGPQATQEHVRLCR